MKTTLKIFIIAISVVLLATLLHNFVFFQNYRIKSKSMLPTLKEETIIMVSSLDKKFEYGDLVVYKNQGTAFAKRIVAMPGDKLQIKAGRLYLNNDVISREFIADISLDMELLDSKTGEFSVKKIAFKKYKETLPNGKSYEIQKMQDDDNSKEFIVPNDSYFVMGDNRDLSMDSRMPVVGFIHKDNMKKIINEK